MFYVKHFDENGYIFQDANVSNEKNLELYMENQLSVGETALVYCAFTDTLLRVVEK